MTISKVALYARVSRYEKGQTPENQLLKLREYASKRDWNVYREFTDTASGAQSSRPYLDEMLSEARARRFDAILIVRIR